VAYQINAVSAAPNPLRPARSTRRRFAYVGIGHALYAAFNWVCDHIVYVFVVYKLGIAVGGAAMTAFSLVQCALTLHVYERMQIDWVGAGMLADLDKVTAPRRWQRVLLWATKRGKVPAFLALSFFQDPFITTAYFRGGRFDRIDSRSWRIFFGSVLVSNVYWTIRAGILAALIANVGSRLLQY
jgi:hypothetical protein